MKLTKYEHACLLIEAGQNKLIIDPGKYTNLPEDIGRVDVVVITHEHADHLDIPNLKQLLSQNPTAELFATKEVTSALEADNIVCKVVEGYLEVDSQGFDLQFTEVDHSIVYGKSPCRNLSIGVGDFLYYPGDSFVGSDRHYEVLALPASGPWFNLIEAIDLAKAFDSKYIIGTHDIFLSEPGRESFYGWVGRHISENQELIHLKPGDSRDFTQSI